MRGSVARDGTSWMFVVDLPRGTDGRRRQQKRRGFPTRKAAEQELQRTLVRAAAGTFVEPTRLSVSQYLLDQWLPAITGTVRSSTLNSYRGNIERHVIPSVGTIRLTAVTAPMLTILYRQLEHESGLSAKTVRHVHTTLRKAMADAMRWGLLDRNPAAAAEPPKLKRQEMRTWTADQVRSFLLDLEGDPLLAVFTLLSTTGMRRGEVLGLRWCDVDFDAHRLHIQQTLTSVNYQLVFGEPKTARGRRMIPVDDHTIAVLRQHRVRQSGDRLAMGVDWADERDLVMVRADGSPIHPDTVSDTFDRRVKASGLPKILFPTIRAKSSSMTGVTCE